MEELAYLEKAARKLLTPEQIAMALTYNGSLKPVSSSELKAKALAKARKHKKACPKDKPLWQELTNVGRWFLHEDAFEILARRLAKARRISLAAAQSVSKCGVRGCRWPTGGVSDRKSRGGID
jgi:hypothetical protein